MKKKMYWGLGVLCILLIATGGFIFHRQWTDIQLLKQETAGADKLLEKSEKPNVPKTFAQKPIDFTQPPPGKTFEGGGHWHDGEWHDAPHETPLQKVNVPIANTTQVSDIPIDKWEAEYQKAHDEWVKKGEAFDNFQKGKWTPEYIQSLSDTQKEEIATRLQELLDSSLNAGKKLEALYEQKKSQQK